MSWERGLDHTPQGRVAITLKGWKGPEGMLSVPVPALAHLGWPCGCQSLCLNKESLLIAEKEGTVAYPQPPAAMSVVLNEGRFSAFLFPELTVPRELLLEGFVTATP